MASKFTSLNLKILLSRQVITEVFFYTLLFVLASSSGRFDYAFMYSFVRVSFTWICAARTIFLACIFTKSKFIYTRVLERNQ